MWNKVKYDTAVKKKYAIVFFLKDYMLMIFKTYALIILMAFSFASCKKDKHTGGGNNKTKGIIEAGIGHGPMPKADNTFWSIERIMTLQ